MNKILIAVPTYEHIQLECFKSIYNLEKPFDADILFDYVKGYDCARARNNICQKYKNFQYIFMVDSDIVLPKDSLMNLYSNLKEIQQMNDTYKMILGAYPRKTEPNLSEIFDYNEKSKTTDYTYSDAGSGDFKPESRYTIERIRNAKAPYLDCKGGGLGCALIDTTLFDSIPKPFFKYVNYDNGSVLSEDLYFCSSIKRHKFSIALDTTFICGHVCTSVL